MPLTSVPAPEAPTEYLERTAPGVDATDPVPITKRITLLGVCAAVVVAWTALLAAAVVGNIYIDPDPTPVSTFGLLAVVELIIFEAALAAGLRDWANRRNQAVERRVRTYVQHETYLLQQGQRQISYQLAMLRAEMHALLGRLPEGVEVYGDDREDQGEDRAIRRLIAAGDTSTPGTVATVSPLYPARSRS